MKPYELKPYYISEEYPADIIFKSAQRIAMPTGKESGPIQAWVEDAAGWEFPAFTGRCLHCSS